MTCPLPMSWLILGVILMCALSLLGGEALPPSPEATVIGFIIFADTKEHSTGQYYTKRHQQDQQFSYYSTPQLTPTSMFHQECEIDWAHTSVTMCKPRFYAHNHSSTSFLRGYVCLVLRVHVLFTEVTVLKIEMSIVDSGQLCVAHIVDLQVASA